VTRDAKKPARYDTDMVPPTLYERTSSLAIPSSIGQQVFTITSGVAGGLAGFLLAYRLKSASHIAVGPLLAASLISAVATFGVVFLITEAKQEAE
jgi:hypothetical protein